jgi:hypothetical protein
MKKEDDQMRSDFGVDVSRERDHDYYKFGNIKEGQLVAVAVQGGYGKDWAAYVGVVPSGTGLDEVWRWIWDTHGGVKLEYRVAKLLFPEFNGKYKWRL